MLPALSELKVLYKHDDALNAKVALWSGDLTVLPVDAIVNAASPTMRGSGGLSGAIFRAAGDEMMQETAKHAPVDAGKAIISRGFNLPARFVIHCVPPSNNTANGKEILRLCYQSILHIVKTQKIRTVALSCLGTGGYGFNYVEASRIVLDEVRKWLETNKHLALVDRVIFVVYAIKVKDEVIYNDVSCPASAPFPDRFLVVGGRATHPPVPRTCTYT